MQGWGLVQRITSSGIWGKERLRARSSGVERDVLARGPAFPFRPSRSYFLGAGEVAEAE